MPGDDALSCDQLKVEAAKVKRDIELVVPLSKALAKNSSNKLSKRSRKAEKIEIKALRSRYDSLMMIAYEKGCFPQGLPH